MVLLFFQIGPCGCFSSDCQKNWASLSFYYELTPLLGVSLRISQVAQECKNWYSRKPKYIDLLSLVAQNIKNLNQGQSAMTNFTGYDLIHAFFYKKFQLELSTKTCLAGGRIWVQNCTQNCLAMA